MKYFKYHALGNDYLVIDPRECGNATGIDPVRVERMCHRNYGVGADGILYGPLPSDECDFGLRIYNPDGGEAEKSGNGLRIFSRYLWEGGLVGAEPFSIMTLGGKVASQVFEGGRLVKVEMGRVSFHSEKIPVLGSPREVLEEAMEIGGESLVYCAATVGNPHCVILCDEISEEAARRLGPLIEREPRFPKRTNVQFLKVLDRATIQIEIWERGAGYTLASGSSSSAAAAVAHRLGRCDGSISVHMPGGVIGIEIGPDFDITMTGPVTAVAQGEIHPEIFE